MRRACGETILFVGIKTQISMGNGATGYRPVTLSCSNNLKHIDKYGIFNRYFSQDKIHV
ncbi:hypothetical protein [Anaeromicrobium sediminis]|uniref:hypothetical protein n=1 Tax=Anaeromicrobium sediminis TaxID=1478221 RepID=UPI001596392F|nr:hypothetical protein [Anaeromicrobium sediminis]